MKKTKIVLFTLLLSIMGVVGSTNAASVNNSSRSADLTLSATRQSSQNLSLSKDNCQNSESGKWIQWSPKIQSFKKGDQVKILLPHGKYTGETLTFKIVDHGKEIATLTIECGNDYGLMVFTADANDGEIAQIIADFGSMDFGSIGTGGVIDIGGITGGCTGDSSSTTSVVDYSSSSTNSKKSIPYGPGPVSVITPPLKSSNLSSAYSSSIDADKVSRRHSSSSSVKRATSRSLSKISGMSVSRGSTSLSYSSSTSKVPTKVSYSSKKQLSSESSIRKNPIRRVSQPIVDQNGKLHLNSQQVRALEQKMPKTAKIVKKIKMGALQSSGQTLNGSKRGLTLKHRRGAHPISNVRRITLPVQGILPATRMDSYTWLYSLIGLAIMIVSGRAFFSKKQK
ncbi:MAG TPA: hypothetical protein H9918_00110 [Candidatus Ligilactobacillus faecavium]|nr:hypothetical protein [Candidatus Ligilactobacillus faecavium]